MRDLGLPLVCNHTFLKKINTRLPVENLNIASFILVVTQDTQLQKIMKKNNHEHK